MSKKGDGTVTMTLDVLDLSVIHMSAYERWIRAFRKTILVEDYPRAFNSTTVFYKAAEVVKREAEESNHHPAHEDVIPELQRTIAAIPFFGADFGKLWYIVCCLFLHKSLVWCVFLENDTYPQYDLNIYDVVLLDIVVCSIVSCCVIVFVIAIADCLLFNLSISSASCVINKYALVILSFNSGTISCPLPTPVHHRHDRISSARQTGLCSGDFLERVHSHPTSDHLCGERTRRSLHQVSIHEFMHKLN